MTSVLRHNSFNEADAGLGTTYKQVQGKYVSTYVDVIIHTYHTIRQLPPAGLSVAIGPTSAAAAGWLLGGLRLACPDDARRAVARCASPILHRSGELAASPAACADDEAAAVM